VDAHREGYWWIEERSLSRKALLPVDPTKTTAAPLPTMAADEVDVIAMLTEGLRYIEIDIVL
jgi:hypothetical protein